MHNIYKTAVEASISQHVHQQTPFSFLALDIQNVTDGPQDKPIRINIENWPLEEATYSLEGLTFPFVTADEEVFEAFVRYSDILALFNGKEEHPYLIKPVSAIQKPAPKPVEEKNPITAMLEKAMIHEANNAAAVATSMKIMKLRKPGED